MFKLQPNPTFRAKVLIHVPGEPAGVPIEFEFRHKTVTEAKALGERYQQAIAERGAVEGNVETLDEIIVGWSGVEAEYSREVLRRLVDTFAGAGPAILKGYMEGLSGARLGN
jgi:hypothetical protein